MRRKGGQSRPYWSRSARRAFTTGRSGARPSPPATSRTSRPRACFHRPAATIGAAHAHDRTRPQVSDRLGDPADEPDRVADARPLPRRAGDRDRHLADPGQVDHVELTGLDVVLRLPLLVLELDREGRHARSLRLGPTARSPDGGRAGRPEAKLAAGASGSRVHRGGHHAVAPPRMAATSSVISIATGHHVMQRPQPTQPETPY